MATDWNLPPEAAPRGESQPMRPADGRARRSKAAPAASREPSGSRLLGEFLRRLRGSRSLQSIEDLSKAPPLEGRIRPVDISTLSKIETGKQLPSLVTLL